MAFKKVAVIGAGLSGLSMLKSLKEEQIECLCFEKSSQIGGLWYFDDDNERGISRPLSTVVTKYSKEMDSFSDHPWPEESFNFLRRRQVHQNIVEFATKFDLLHYIRFNREVVKVFKAENYKETGKWMVTVKNTVSGEETSFVFDGVMLCTGQSIRPRMFDVPGKKTFQGRIIQLHEVETFQTFANQNVVIVGLDSSSVHAAEGIGQVAKQVYISSSSDSWFIRRLCHTGLPYDYLIFRRCFLFLLKLVNVEYVKYLSKILERHICNFMFDHKMFGINPAYHALCQEPVIYDDLAIKMMSESIILNKDIVEIGFDSVKFKGDDSVTKIDTIVLIPRYAHSFEYLEKGVLMEQGRGNFQLFKLMYPSHLEHPTLAFIGFFRSWGPSLSLCELQTRWAARLIKSNGSLQNTRTKQEDIDLRYKYNSQRFPSSENISQHVDCMTYADDIASQIGAKPNLLTMAFRDPRLFLYCFFGPFVSYQYRLQGPHKWDGAKQAIFSVQERMSKPWQKDREEIPNVSTLSVLFNLVLTILLVCLPLMLLFSTLSNILWYIVLIHLVYTVHLSRKYGCEVFYNPAYICTKLLISLGYLLANIEFIKNLLFNV